MLRKASIIEGNYDMMFLIYKVVQKYILATAAKSDYETYMSVVWLHQAIKLSNP